MCVYIELSNGEIFKKRKKKKVGGRKYFIGA